MSVKKKSKFYVMMNCKHCAGEGCMDVETVTGYDRAKKAAKSLKKQIKKDKQEHDWEVEIVKASH